MENISKSPLITVVTVVFNGKLHIEKTIKSVLEQDYDNLEHVIIDGCSTDGTVEIIKKYGPCISYWVSEKDLGIYDAMNKGWQRADDASRILFLGAGDTIKELPSVKEILSNDNKVIYGVTELHNRDFKSVCDWRLKLGNTLHHQSLLVPKKLHKEPPFNLNIKVYADYDFNLRLYNSGVEFLFSPAFKSYALPDGVSAKLGVSEISSVSRNNCGVFWGIMSKLYCHFQIMKSKVSK